MSVWVSIHADGCLWVSMGVIGVWGFMGVCESPWVIMGGSINSHGCLRVGKCWYMVYIGVGMTMGVSWYMGDYG